MQLTSMKMQLLLISSSFIFGKGYLEHCKEAVRQFLDELPDGEVLFIPYAANTNKWDEYSESCEKFFVSLGQSYKPIHECENPSEYIAKTKLKMIFIGGGNTFLLIKTLQDKGLIEPIQEAVGSGVGYMGASAGSNITCPTIQTTNDMPIVEPQSFKALNLVNFQINPHFISGSLVEGHKGESREQRIAEFHEVNETLVIGLPESSWIRVKDGNLILNGGGNATIFEKDKSPGQWSVGTQLNL